MLGTARTMPPQIRSVMSMNNLNRYRIDPLLGIGPVRFGMNRHEVQNVMPETSKPFMKTKFSKVETDSFHEAGFQVFYNEKACVEYIELSRGCPFIAELFSIDPFRFKVEELIKKISEKAKYDESNPEIGYSFIFPEIELSLWRSDIEDKYFLTIGIGQKGYYSSKSS